jgi:diguanylate cyclase (GGDEF)-like protein
MPARPAQTGLVRTLAAAGILGGLALVGLLDYWTGPYLSFALLYITLVLAAAWWLGRVPALLAGVTAGVAWFVAEAAGRKGEPRADLFWNAGTRFVMLTAMAAMVVRIRADRRALKTANAKLGELLSGAEQLARTDPLTGLPNRRAFLERVSDELARGRRTRRPVSVAYLDLDNFKRLNDKLGHPEGDQFLRDVADAIRETVRSSDVAARLGGDEFAVLFAEARRSAVEPLALRLLQRLQALGERHPELDLGASIGMAWFDEPPKTAEELLERADRAMYDAKSRGKHRFSLFTGPAE